MHIGQDSKSVIFSVTWLVLEVLVRFMAAPDWLEFHRVMCEGLMIRGVWICYNPSSWSIVTVMLVYISVSVILALSPYDTHFL